MMCGDQYPSWTKEDVLAFTEPKLGYTRESPGEHQDLDDEWIGTLC
jgi:hypothetical protein